MASTPKETAGEKAVSAFKSACGDRSLSIGGCSFQYNDDYIASPAGGYWNRNIQVTLPDGRIFHFDAGLTQRNPELAAFELMNMMKGPTAV